MLLNINVVTILKIRVMTKRRIKPLTLTETLRLDSKAIEIFNEVYANFEKEITVMFKSRVKKELKELLPVGSVIKTSKLVSPDMRADFKTENVYKGMYQKSMFKIEVPHLTKT